MAVDSNVEPNWVERNCKSEYDTCSQQLLLKNGRKNCGKGKLWKWRAFFSCKLGKLLQKNQWCSTEACYSSVQMYRLGRGDHLYTISEMSGLGISTVSSGRKSVKSWWTIYGMRLCQLTCLRQERSSNKKFSTLKNFGNFLAAGQQ